MNAWLISNWDAMGRRKSINVNIASLILVFLALCLWSLRSWAGTTTEKRPRVFLEYNTSEEPIDAKAVKMWINGIDVSSDILVLPGEVSFTPKKDLELGDSRVKVLLVDLSGDRIEKEWSFTVVEGHPHEPWKLRFANNSLANGQVTKKNQVEFKLLLEGAKANDLIWSCYLSRDGGLYERQVWNLVNIRTLSYELKTLNDGSYTLEFRARHPEQGNEQRISTSFVVDRRAPALSSLKWTPALHILGRHQGLSFDIVDPPWNSAKNIKVSISGPEGRTWSSSLKHQSSRVEIALDHRQLQHWGEGIWPVRVTLEDYAGHKTESHGHFLQTVSNSEQLLGDDLVLEPYPRVRSDFEMDLRGRTNMYGSIRLLVNGEQRAQRSLGSHLSEAGVFELKNIALEPGINTLSFDIFNSSGRRSVNVAKPPPFLSMQKDQAAFGKVTLIWGSPNSPCPNCFARSKITVMIANNEEEWASIGKPSLRP